MQNNYGLAIRLFRAYKGWSQAELARLAKTDSGHLSRIESGTKKPSLDLLQRISDALGVELAEILADEVTFVLNQPHQ